jgi:hypothetical protein
MHLFISFSADTAGLNSSSSACSMQLLTLLVLLLIRFTVASSAPQQLSAPPRSCISTPYNTLTLVNTIHARTYRTSLLLLLCNTGVPLYRAESS